MHRIVGPHTGEPALADLLSVTVGAPGAMTTEVAARTVLILSSREGMEWLEARPHLAGLRVLQDGSTGQSSDFSPYLWD